MEMNNIENFFNPPLTIKVFNKHVECVAIKNNNKITKTLNFNTFKSLFSEKILETPVFPLWTLKYKSTYDYIEMIVGEKINNFTIKYNRTIFPDYHDLTLHIPYMFLHLYYKKTDSYYRLAKSRVLGSFLRPNEDLSNLRILSLPNTYTDSGWICWGQIGNSDDTSVISTTNLSSVYKLWFMWHNMYSNDDLVKYPSVLDSDKKIFTFENEFNAASFVKYKYDEVPITNYFY